MGHCKKTKSKIMSTEDRQLHVKGIENIFNTITAENFVSLRKGPSNTTGIYRTLTRWNQKKKTPHIIFQLKLYISRTESVPQYAI